MYIHSYYLHMLSAASRRLSRLSKALSVALAGLWSLPATSPHSPPTPYPTLPYPSFLPLVPPTAS